VYTGFWWGNLRERDRLEDPGIGERIILGYMRIYLFYFLFIYLITAIALLPGGSGYFTCKQNMKLVTTRFKSGGLYKKHVVATWNVGNHLSICL